MVIHSQSHVRRSFERGRATRDEKNTRVGELEQKGDESRCHDLRTGRVDVPGLIPHIA